MCARRTSWRRCCRALRKLTEGYAALGAAAKKTLAGLIPELAALIEAAEEMRCDECGEMTAFSALVE